MLDYTDRHCRYFLRGFSPRALLYTEMITTEALLRGDTDRLPAVFRPRSTRSHLQLGGSDPVRARDLGRHRCRAGYDESISLRWPERSRERRLVRRLTSCAIRRGCGLRRRLCEAVDVPVTVKMRIGVLSGGARSSREQIAAFRRGRIASRSRSSWRRCRRRLRHAHRARTQGGARRSLAEGEPHIPPLHYDVVRWLKNEFPAIGSSSTVVCATRRRCSIAGLVRRRHLGREAYHRPVGARELHEAVYADGWPTPRRRPHCSPRMADYAEREMLRGEIAVGRCAPHAGSAERASPARGATGSICRRARASPAPARSSSGMR